MFGREAVRYGIIDSGRFAVVAAGVLALPALWSLISAVHSAVTTGEVLVLSIGRTSTARKLVPWTEGWARFVAPPLIWFSLALWLASGRSRDVRRVSVIGCGFGVALLTFSWWFSSLKGAIAFAIVAAFIALALLLGKGVGRVAAYGFITAAALLCFWWAIRQV